MASCELDISLDEPGRRYAPGERVAGVVKVACGDEVRCNGLTIQRFWRTTGEGNEQKGLVEADQLFAGSWPAGSVSEYRFQVLVPNGPATYEGEVLGVEWVLKAEADVPWARDPYCEDTFTVVPDGDARDLDLGPLHEPSPQDVGAVPEKMGVAMASAVLMNGCGLVMVFAEGWIPTIMGLGCLTFGTIAGYLALHNKIASRKLGPVSVTLDEATLTPGREVELTLAFSPKRALTLNGVKAELSCKEEAAKGAGDKKKKHHHVVHQDDVEVCDYRQLRAGESFSAGVRLQVPLEAPSSFHATDNSVAWTIGVHVDIPNWPDWFRSWPITVAPSGRPRLSAPARVIVKTQPTAPPPPLAPRPPVPPIEQTVPQTVPLVVTEATPPTLSSEVRPPPAAPLTLDDLQGLATRLTGDLRFAGDQEIEAAMAELVGRTLRTDLRVESVERISSFDRAEHLRGGSRLIGEVGEQLSVQVGLPATAAAAPERGDSVTVSAKLVGWDGLYRRLVLESQG